MGIEFGSNFLSDITSGKSAKSTAKKRGMESLKKTVKKVLIGQGRRIKKKKCRALKLKDEKLQRKKLVGKKEKSKFLKKKKKKKKIGGKKKKSKIFKKKKKKKKK